MLTDPSIVAIESVSRILSAGRRSQRLLVLGSATGRAIIPLGRTLLPGSSDLPGGCDAPSRHVLAWPSPAACGGRQDKQDSPPIWSCSVWGFPCPGHYCPGGALLPHLFTLTSRSLRNPVGGMFSVALSVTRSPRAAARARRRRPDSLAPSARTLYGTLLCGVRTFLFLTGVFHPGVRDFRPNTRKRMPGTLKPRLGSDRPIRPL